MNKDDFIRRWRAQLVVLGIDSLAVLNGPREMKEHKANTLLELPGKIDALLARMYDELKPGENGKPAGSILGQKGAKP